MAAPAKGAGKNKADIDDIQSVAEIKTVIALARRGGSANCLIGSTDDDEAIIFVDKKRAPKALIAMVQKAAGDAGITMNRQSMRYGRLSYKLSDGQDVPTGGDGGAADGDDDASGRVLHILVNKEPAGALTLKLTRRLKEVGCAKFEIHVDAGIENEADTPADAAAAGAPTSAPTAPDAATSQATTPDDNAATGGTTSDDQGTTPPSNTATSAPPADGQTGAPQPPTGPDMAELQGTLVGLMRELPSIIQSAPDQRADLVKLATTAGNAVKSGDVAAAGPAINALQAAIEQVQSGATTPGGTAPDQADAPQGAAPAAAIPAATVAKTKLIWDATRSAVEKQLDGLQSKMAEAYQDHGFGADLEKVFKSKIDPMLNTLDTELSDVLDNAAKSKDPAEQKQLIGQAKQVIGKYEDYLAREPLIRQLDDNPFMPVQIEATLTKTLEVLNRTIGAMAGA